MATRDYDDIVNVAVFCDECEITTSGDYIVPAGADSLAVARNHLATFEGWLISNTGDFCPDCRPKAGDTIHVYPTKDLIEHDIETDQCVCGPRIEREHSQNGIESLILVHNSLDGREAREEAEAERKAWEKFAEYRKAVWCVCAEYNGLHHIANLEPPCAEPKAPTLDFLLDIFKRDAIHCGIPLPPAIPRPGKAADW